MNVSINSLMMAMFSVHRDIKHHEALNNDESLKQEAREEYGQYVLDLTHVLGELGMAYKEAQQDALEFPTIDELLKKINSIQ